MDLQEFREALDDLYSFPLASDSLKMVSLVMYFRVSEQCGNWTTFFRVKAPGGFSLETQSLAEASRRYWEVVYRDR